MKKTVRTITAAAVCVCLVFCALAVCTSAAENMAHFATLDSARDVTIVLRWETERPLVYFLSPGGEKYNPFAEREGAQSVIIDDTLYYRIENAEAGDWFVVYDKLSNENIYIALEDSTSLFTVDDVVVTDVSNDRATVSFTANYDERVYYDYTVNIAADDTSAVKELYSGSAVAGDKVTVEIDLLGLYSYDSYRIAVRASFYRNGAEIFDTGYSEPFSYSNPYSHETTTPFFITIYPDSCSAEISWEPKYGISYLPAMSEDGEEAQFTETEDTELSSYEFSYSPDAKTLTFSFADKNAQFYSTPKTVTVNLSELPVVTFPEGEVTNKSVIYVAYSNVLKESELILSNGAGESRRTVSGSGGLYLSLPDRETEIRADIAFEENVTVRYTKTLYVDTTAPFIYMLRDYSAVTTAKDSIELAGTVSGCTELLVNGEKAELDRAGGFVYTAKLKDGRNVFEIKASDPAGNSTVYTATVTKTVPDRSADTDGGEEGETKDGSLLGLLLDIAFIAGAVTLGLICTIFALVSWRRKKAFGTGGACAVLGITAGAAGALFTYSLIRYLVCIKTTKSTDFIKLASESIPDAYRLLETEHKYATMSLVSGIVFGVLAAAFAAVGVIHLVKRKKKKAGNGDAE